MPPAMPIAPEQVQISSPCPVDLDETGLRGKGKSWHCGHCDKAVHVLSQMTESDARAFLRDNAGQDVCVSYAIKPDGEIRFRPEATIVPITSLVRRPARIAAVGLGLALAACTPHDNPEALPRATLHMETVPTPVVRPQLPIVAPTVAPDIQVDGGMRVPQDIQVEGGMRPRPIADEPCDPPKPVSKPAAPVTKRGRWKRSDL
jgi:hypothetical protein